MSEAKLFATNGFNGGVSAGIRADNYQEFLSLAKQVYGDAEGEAFAKNAFDQLLSAVPTAQAVRNVNSQLGPVSVVSNTPVPAPQSNVVQMPQPQAQAGGLPPGVQYPGDCAHGRRQYKSSQTKRGTWTRFECAVPWSKDATDRCQAINV